MPKRDPKKATHPSEEYDEEFHTSEEEGVVDPHLMGELWDEEPTSVSPDEPEPEEDEEDDEEEEGVEEPETSEEEEVEEPEEPEEGEEESKTYKVKDKEYDLDTLVKEGLLEDLITQASQVAHFQKLYEEQRQQNEVVLQHQRQLAAQQQQQQLAQQQAQGAPAVSIDQVRAAMAPQVERAVQEGFFEPDFVEMYPNAAAAQMFIYSDYIQMKQVLMGMYQHFMRNSAQQQYEAAQNTFNAACASLANRHELYKGLTEEEERGEFFRFLAERVNPAVDAIDEEFLARQYLGYKQESVLEAVRQDRTKKGKAKKKKRKLAKGEGRGSARKGGRRQDQSVDEVVMSGLMEQFTE